MPQEKFYCGLQQQLPDGYDRYGNRYQCLRKGYGACLYSGKLGNGRIRVLTLHHKMNMFLFIMIILLLFLCIGLIMRRDIHE